MTFVDSVKTCAYTKIFNWQDRAPRSEFWWFMLFNWLVSVPLSTINFIPLIGALAYGLIGLYLQWATILVCIRRLHDVDRSGWWLLYLFTPILVIMTIVFFASRTESLILLGLSLIALLSSFGLFVYFLILLISPGTHGDNYYGTDPLWNESVEEMIRNAERFSTGSFSQGQGPRQGSQSQHQNQNYQQHTTGDQDFSQHFASASGTRSQHHLNGSTDVRPPVDPNTKH